MLQLICRWPHAAFAPIVTEDGHATVKGLNRG